MHPKKAFFFGIGNRDLSLGGVGGGGVPFDGPALRIAGAVNVLPPSLPPDGP